MLMALACAAHAQTRATVLRNELVTVIRRVWDPHEVFMAKNVVPPAALIFVTDYNLRFTYADRPAEEHAGKAGEAVWIPAGEYAIENPGREPLPAYRIEVKP